MYRLSNSLPYLLARLGVRMGELFVRVVRKEGLTLPMYRVLASLYSDAGDFRSAVGFLKQVQERDPNYSRANNVDGDIGILESRIKR